jgi:hypothetical protein
VATAHGGDTLAHLDLQLRVAEEQVLSGLDTGEDRQVFRRLLRRLAVHASAGEPVQTPCEVAADVAVAQHAGAGPLPC